MNTEKIKQNKREDFLWMVQTYLIENHELTDVIDLAVFGYTELVEKYS